MAVIRDPDGVTHLVDIFDGGTWCGRDWGEDWQSITGKDYSCEACLSDAPIDDAPSPIGPDSADT